MSSAAIVMRFNVVYLHGMLKTVLLVAMLLETRRCAAEEPLASDLALPDVLKNLQSRDVQVDNVNIMYSRSGVLKLKRAVTSLGRNTPRPSGPPREYPYEFAEQMIVLGPEVTFVRELDKNFIQDDGRGISPFYKSSNRHGLIKEINDSHRNEKGHRVLEKKSIGFPVEIIDEERMEVEFALGFGYGKRIKSIESAEMQNDLILLKGIIQIWWEDISTFEILIDKDLIVRRAQINSNVAGNRTQFTIETKGTARDRFSFAQNGHFRRAAMGRSAPAANAGREEIIKEFDLDYRQSSWDLSSEKYDQLTVIDEIAEDAQIIDRSGLTTPPSTNDEVFKRRQNTSVWLLVMNLVFLGVGIIIAFYRRRVHRKSH